MQAFSEVFPHLVTAADVPNLVKIDDVDFAGVDAVFCCLPHATTQKIIKALPEHLKIVDLSADFRLADVNTYAEWCAAHVAADCSYHACAMQQH
jgi:N-acetyl-gamma-glutamyl-phosphate reductase